MSQSTVTEKRTVISSSSSNVDDALADIGYKPSFGSRASNIMSRSIASPMRQSVGGGSSIVRTVEYGYGQHMGAGLGPGGYSNVSSTGVNTVKTNREQEKKDMRDLNERFANYIEKVRFLEAQNKKLGTELDDLRSKWGKETTHIKQMYEAELAEARKLIDDLSRDKAALEIKMSSIQEQYGDLNRQLDEAREYRQKDRDQINKLNQQLSDYEAEISMLRRSIESLETERARDKATINRLQQEVDKLRIDLNNETLAHLDAENRRQTLEEEMEFMKKVHEQELKELAALAYRDTTAENREFWKSELAQAIRDIQAEYDNKVDQLRGDMEGFYNLKIQEFRTGATKQNMEVTHVREENKKITKQMSDLRGKLADLEAKNAYLEKQYQDILRDFDSKDGDHMMEVTQLREEISKQRAEMEGILTELQTLMDAKLSLELEIAAYRKLLEGEENRVDWRSRASAILYRDAFRPRQNAGQPGDTKETAISASRHQEHENIFRDSSSDTATASSVTTSEQGISPKGEDVEKNQTGDSKLNIGGGEVVKSHDTEKIIEEAPDVYPDANGDETKKVIENYDTKSSDFTNKAESPKEEPLVKVKEEVQKLESKVDNGTEKTIIERKVDDIKYQEGKEVAIEETTSKNETIEEPTIEETIQSHLIIDNSEQNIKTKSSDETTDEADGKKEAVQDETESSQQIIDKSQSSTDVKEVIIKEEQLATIADADIVKKSPNSEFKQAIESVTKSNELESSNDSQIKTDQKVNDKEILDRELETKQTENEQITTEKDIKDSNLELKIDKQSTADREETVSTNDSEAKIKIDDRISEKSDAQTDLQVLDKQVVEKTEDKVLETGVQSEATEESYKKNVDMATVELSPTKEKPQAIEKVQLIKEDMLKDPETIYEQLDDKHDNSKSDEGSKDKDVSEKKKEEEPKPKDITRDQSEDEERADISAVQKKEDGHIEEESKAKLTEIKSNVNENAEFLQSTEEPTPLKEEPAAKELKSTPLNEQIQTSKETKIVQEHFGQTDTISSVTNTEIVDKKTSDLGHLPETSSKEPDSEIVGKIQLAEEISATEASVSDQTKEIAKADNQSISKETKIESDLGGIDSQIIKDQSESKTETIKSISADEKPNINYNDNDQTRVLESDISNNPQLESKSDISLTDNVEKQTHDSVSIDSSMKNDTESKLERDQSKLDSTAGKKDETLGLKAEIDSKQTISDTNEKKVLSDVSVKSSENVQMAVKDSEETEKSKKDDSVSPSQEKLEPSLTDQMPSDEQKPVKDIVNGDIQATENASLMKEAKNILPLTNGEIESPTEEKGDQIPDTSEGDDSQMSMKMMRGEVSAKTTYQRTSTGPISISEVDTEGKSITLENTSAGSNRRDVNLDGWKLRRLVDGKWSYTYPFKNYTLKAGKSVKILARKSAANAGLNDLVFRDEDTWGVGSNVTTTLINEKEEDKATHVQNTLYN